MPKITESSRIDPPGPAPEIALAIANRPTPLLVYDLRRVEENYLRIQAALGGAQIFYAMKADPHPRVLRRLVELGAGFDAASRAELDGALSAGCPPERISFGNTVKRRADIQYAYESGVRLFVADQDAELEKLARHAPGSLVFIRLRTEKTDSHYPLTDKFGADRDVASDLLRRAREIGLVPHGLSFHVGSECFDASEWRKSLEQVAAIVRDLEPEGHELRFVNVGGGFPRGYGTIVPEPEEIGRVIGETLARELPGRAVTLAAEPGRYIVADAALVATRVVLRARRRGQDWLHLDAGIYNGLFEASCGLRYEVVAPGRSGPKLKFTLAGPTCEGFDVLYRDVELPACLDEGDLVLFKRAGAYAASCSTSFNGFGPPEALFVEDL